MLTEVNPTPYTSNFPTNYSKFIQTPLDLNERSYYHKNDILELIK